MCLVRCKPCTNDSICDSWLHKQLPECEPFVTVCREVAELPAFVTHVICASGLDSLKWLSSPLYAWIILQPTSTTDAITGYAKGCSLTSEDIAQAVRRGTACLCR